MQRTLITLGLTLLLLGSGCDEPPPEHIGAQDASTYCSLPEEQCAAFDGQSRNEDADAGLPIAASDAATFFDAIIPSDAESGGDTGIAAMDAGTPDGSSTFTNPCNPADCRAPQPIAATCGDGDQSDVVCKPSFFGGACEWHLDCGAP